jgi:hypothetical protein
MQEYMKQEKVNTYSFLSTILILIYTSCKNENAYTFTLTSFEISFDDQVWPLEQVRIVVFLVIQINRYFRRRVCK